MNKKLLYKPPKVKPSKRAKKPLPEWNSFQTDLDKYKLSSTEILKKKINAVSKNKEIAKKDWLETLSQLQTGKYINDETDKHPRKKIDLVPRHRFQKDERGIIPKSRPKSAAGKHINIRNKDKDRDKDNEEEDDENDDELKMIYNEEEDDIEVIATKVEKNSIVPDNKRGIGRALKSNSTNNPLVLQEFEETLKQMEKEIQSNNNIIDNQLNEQKKQMQINSKLPNQSEKSRGKTKEIPKYNKQSVTKSNKDYNKNNNEINRHRSDNEDEGEGEGEDRGQIDELSNSNDNDNEEDKDDVYEMQKNIDKKFNKLNDIEDCMKRLDCMLDNSKQKSMKMKFDLDFKEGEGYRSEEELEERNKNNSMIPQAKPLKNSQNNKPVPKQNTNNYIEEADYNFGYRSEIKEKRDHNIHYDNNLRDSELYLTDRKLQEQLMEKEKQIRQNLQTSPNKPNEDTDDYHNIYNKDMNEEGINNNQDVVNQARLLSIKNELLKSNKITKTDNQISYDDNNHYQSIPQQRNFSTNNNNKEFQLYDRILQPNRNNGNEYTHDYNNLRMPKKSNDYNKNDDQENAYYNNEFQIHNNNYIQQPPIQKPTADYCHNNNYNNAESNHYNNSIKQSIQCNKPLYSLSNNNKNENNAKQITQAINKNNNNSSYNYNYKDDLEEEQPYQFNPNKLNEVSSSYTTGAQGKSIKIERNIIDITKQKAKVVGPNETNMFEYSGKQSGLTNNSNNDQRLNNKVKNTSDDSMDYLKNLLEKTKEEIDNLTQGLDDVQPSITSYSNTQFASQNNNYNQIPRQDYYNNYSNNKYHN